MTIAEFDHLETDKRKELLQQCCGSSCWVDKMLAEPPFEDLVDLDEVAEENWWKCSEQDWLEAFKHHPKIGDVSSLREKFESTAALALREQSGISEASDDVLKELTEMNIEYEKKFGFIFIVCATGKGAGEMLQILKSRINNDPKEEIEIAADEQIQITKLRLEKLFA